MSTSGVASVPKLEGRTEEEMIRAKIQEYGEDPGWIGGPDE